MTDFERILSNGLFALFLSLPMLTLAFAIFKRRPVVIAPGTAAGAVLLSCLSWLAVITVRPVVDSLNSDSIVSSLALSLAFPLVSAAVVGVVALGVAQYFWLFNVTERMVVDALGSALQKQGLAYELSRGSGLFAWLSRGTRITIAVPEKGFSIKVAVESFGRARVRFAGKKRIPNYEALVVDFKRSLAANECGGSVWFGFAWGILAMAVIGVLIHSLVQAFV